MCLKPVRSSVRFVLACVINSLLCVLAYINMPVKRLSVVIVYVSMYSGRAVEQSTT